MFDEKMQKLVLHLQQKNFKLGRYFFVFLTVFFALIATAILYISRHYSVPPQSQELSTRIVNQATPTPTNIPKPYIKGIDTSTLKEKEGKVYFQDEIYGYVMDLSLLPKITITTQGDRYPFIIYPLDINQNENGSADGRFFISAPMENPTHLSTEEFAKQILDYKEGQIEKSFEGQGLFDSSPITYRKIQEGVTAAVWKLEKGDAYHAAYYLLPIKDRMILFQLKTSAKNDDLFPLFEKELETFKLNKEFSPAVNDPFFWQHNLVSNTKLTITPNSGKTGDKIVIKGENWKPNLSIKIMIAEITQAYGPADLYGDIKTNAEGSFEHIITVPKAFSTTPQIPNDPGFTKGIMRVVAYSPDLEDTQKQEAIFYLLSKN